MIFGFIILGTALTLSVVAAFYSISGLVAIFSALPVPIIIMGGALEIAKIVSTVFLHNNWTRLPKSYKMYLIPAVTILMFLTSIGIFGLLSKAHSDQALVSGDVTSKLSIYDEKIKTAKENIESDRKQLKQMDEAVDQIMGRSSDEKGADKANAVRKSQQRDRQALAKDIGANQKIINQLNDEAAPIRAEVRKVEADVGPLKYIAALIYGDSTDANMLEKAVRWVILLIVCVFDPLALTLILAANKQFEWTRQGTGGWNHEEAEKFDVVDSDPTISPPVKHTLFGILGDKIAKLNLFKKQVGQTTESKTNSTVSENDDDVLEPIVDKIEAPWVETREIDEDSDVVETSEWTNEDYEQMIKELLESRDESIGVIEGIEKDPIPEITPKFIGFSVPLSTPYLQPKVAKDSVEEKMSATDLPGETPTSSTTPFTFEILDEESILNLAVEPDESSTTQNPYAMDERPGDYIEPPHVETTWTPATPTDEEHAVQQLKEIGYLTETGEVDPEYQPNENDIDPEEPVATPTPVAPISLEAAPGRNRGRIYSEPVMADNSQIELGRASNTDFGNQFPSNPNRGDVYLRTDFLPNRLFKYTGQKWIEVDKDSTDVYAYEDEYIKHLIEEITAGRYDLEMLTEIEQTQIANYLKKIGINVQ
jgi:hypothetical protein